VRECGLANPASGGGEKPRKAQAHRLRKVNVLRYSAGGCWEKSVQLNDLSGKRGSKRCCGQKKKEEADLALRMQLEKKIMDEKKIKKI